MTQPTRQNTSLRDAGLEPAVSLEELVARLESPRILLLYVPHGEPTESVCRELRPLLAKGDIVADGGNSHWEDSKRRHALFAEAGVGFLDVGTSGGVEGARHGACFMAGGDQDTYQAVAPLLRNLAVDDEGVVFAGEPGAGHFVKLVHNAIEFGMVQAIAEGVELMERSDFELDLVGGVRQLAARFGDPELACRADGQRVTRDRRSRRALDVRRGHR